MGGGRHPHRNGLPLAPAPTGSQAEHMAEDPALMRELERLGLDVCGGDRDSLKEACQQYGLDLTAEVAELSSQPLADQPPAEWVAM